MLVTVVNKQHKLKFRFPTKYFLINTQTYMGVINKSYYKKLPLIFKKHFKII